MNSWCQLLGFGAVGLAAGCFGGSVQAEPCTSSGSSTTCYGLTNSPSFDPSGDAETAQLKFLEVLGPLAQPPDGFSGSLLGPATSVAMFGGNATLAGDGKVTNLGCLNGSCTGRFDTTNGSGSWWETKNSFTLSINADPNTGLKRTFSSFGFYATDVGDFLGGLSVLFKDINGKDFEQKFVLPAPPNDTLLEQEDPGNLVPNGTLLFFGIVDTDRKFSSVTFTVTQTNVPGTDQPRVADFLGFDDFILGDLSSIEPPVDIPEPTTLALVAASLAGLVATRRRLPR